MRVGTGTIRDSGFFGTYHQCTAPLDGLELPIKVRLPQKDMPQTGQNLSLYADPKDLVLLIR